jgi:hypothetical protein
MEGREVTDQENITWNCIQAFAGLSGAAAEKAAELTTTADGTVTVVCTPGGKAQTVRLQLSEDWSEALPDEELLSAIAAARQEG